MSTPAQPDSPDHGQLLVYAAEDGKLKIDVRLEGETVWLTQQHMADLFQTTKQNVGQHLKNIFEEGELTEPSVVKNFFTTAADSTKPNMGLTSWRGAKVRKEDVAIAKGQKRPQTLPALLRPN